MKTLAWIALGMLSVTTLVAEIKKAFPGHWGKPPEIQTQDYIELPDGFGHGSSTVKHWINAQLEKDQPTKEASKASARVALYTNDFEKAEAGTVPDDVLVLGGEFTVKREGTNQFLELPGAPLDSFAVQFGPAAKDEIAVTARIFGTGKGRRAPSFGVGLGGVSGWKLQVSPSKKAVELLKDQELKATVNHDWKSGSWTQLRIEIRKVKDGAWKIEGKAWSAGEVEPKAALISFDETEEPTPGKASILGSPFAGTPLWFDELRVEKIETK